MSIVACPRCRDEVTLPAKVSPQARVRCPLCRDEYILSEALAKMPPALIVLDAGPEVSGTGYAEPEYKVAESAPAMGGVFDSSPAVGEAPAMPRPGVKGGVRPKKKSGGGAASQIIQVVLGGIGAFALFNPIAWWGMDQDPFSMGPIVAKYVPSVVPVKYRGGSSSNGGGNNANVAKNNNKAAPPVPDVVKNKKNNGAFDTGDKFKNLEPNELKPTLDPLDPGTAPTLPPEPEVKIDDPLKPAVGPGPLPGGNKPLDFTPPMPKPEDPNAPPKVSSTDVTTAYAFAVNKREDFEASNAAKEEVSVRQQKGKDLYEAAAELGRLFADADLADEKNSEKISLIQENLTSKIVNYGSMIARFADQRLADGAKEEGIVVSGVIKDIKPLGATYETTIEVTRPDASKTVFSVPIVTTKSLEDDGAKPGDTLFVLGKIVRDPKKDLPNYKGEALQVVHAGHTTLVPAK